MDAAWSCVICRCRNDCLQSETTDTNNGDQANEQNARKLELTSTHEQNAKRLRMCEWALDERQAMSAVASSVNVEPRTFCRTVRRVTLTGEVKN